MSDFTLHLHDGEDKYVVAETVNEAAKKVELFGSMLENIIGYTKDGVHYPVAAQADCGCWYHAEDGWPCVHDLQRVGLVN